MLVDSHCHLDFPDFADDLDGVMARAAAEGVSAMLTIGTRVDSFDRVLAVAERYDHVWCTVGVHPHDSAAEPDVTCERLVALADNPRVVGIGESGLDYHYDHSPRDRQRESFRVHIEAARETGLPLVVHSRDADDDTLAILAEEMERGVFRGLIHCFTAGRGVAEAAVALGLHVSFSGIVTFKNAAEIRAIASDLPVQRLLVETDAPYLAPVPHRGARNAPEFLPHTAACVAALHHLPLADFARITTDTFFNLFNKADAP